MPKLGMQPIRSSALINAVIAEIGESGTMDVTVSQIAKRAGMSTALAHHYFGSKNKMFVAAMRHILTQYSTEMRNNLNGVKDPFERIEVIIQTSFSDLNMKRETVAAWLNFYVFAQKSDEVARLLKIYHKRLESNLRFELRQIAPEKAESVAEGIAAIIDGGYIRWVLRGCDDVPQHPENLAIDYLRLTLADSRILR
ncbi:TetR family transcriptional regulator [Pacificibacter maritimus]|uniref:HTH-type transcriptional regulator BetI n=2 Tax=Pacificibacter maritimus TaxID=762213 RepID=A0A3N4U1T8_9RHOB|nr:TetR family transcriptional regulator [Pacificibacter maritimus]